MSLIDLTIDSVNKAIAEYDVIGREAFLAKYGFGQSRSYLVRVNGNLYDSKAIAGAAHGYLPGLEPLQANQFSGGNATVKKVLDDLGFEVVVGGADVLPRPGDVLGNTDVSRIFGVGTMGGMRRSTSRNLLVLISDPFKGLYQDRWEGGVLHYTGMGPEGPQDINYAQNRTLAQSPATAITIHLLEAMEPMKYTYVGEVELSGKPYQEQQFDKAGKLRDVWMFPLKLKSGGSVPVLTHRQAQVIEQAHSRLARRLSTDELRLRAKAANKKPAVRNSQTVVFVRDAAVPEYVKRFANGICDLCSQKAPFRDGYGEPYLECHHVDWLARGGADAVENAVALCPNCHRKMHVLDSTADRKQLLRKITARDL